MDVMPLSLTDSTTAVREGFSTTAAAVREGFSTTAAAVREGFSINQHQMEGVFDEIRIFPSFAAQRQPESIPVANAICSGRTGDLSAVAIIEHPQHSRHGFLPALEDVCVAEPQHSVTRSDDAIRAHSIDSRLVPLVAIQLDNEPSVDDEVDSVNPDLHLLPDPKAERVKSHFGDCFESRSGEKCQVVREPMQALWEALDDVRNSPTRHPISGDCAL